MAFCLALLTLMILTSQGLCRRYHENPWRYEYRDYYFDQEPNMDPPTFLARPQTFTVEVGQSVIIPCDVDNAGGMLRLIIKKVPANGGSEKLVSVGSDKVMPDPRMTVDGSRLTISHIRPRDAGTFICQFDLEPPVQLRHTLHVQYAPSVRAMVPLQQHVAKGKSVTLECKAHGNPEPIMRWSRQEGPLSSGQQRHQGHRLTLERVDRHMEGTYLCTADNGIGEPASAAMSLTVEYPPEIITQQPIVWTGEGDRVELVCVVHGRPPPDVVWTHKGRPLPDTLMDTQLHLPQQPYSRAHTTYDAHLSQTHVAHRHSLTIHRVTERDFGKYVCIAENAHGQNKALIQMTGHPKRPQLLSNPVGMENTRYTLTWETESYLPITEFLIKYRKSHLGAWHRNRTMLMAGTWQNVSRVVVNSGAAPEGRRHFMVYTLEGLEVATFYIAIVSVRNRYGWSAESDRFSFSTRRAMAVLPSTSGARCQATASAFTLLLLLSLLLAPL